MEAYPGELFMRSLSGDKDVLVFKNASEYAFSVPVDAEVRAKANPGDRLFVFDGVDWVEVESYFNIENGEITAYVSGARNIYVGDRKPSTKPSVFSVLPELGRVKISIPYDSYLNLIIYGLSGRKVKEYRFDKLPGGRYEFSIGDLPRGVYVVKVRTSKHSSIVKVINGGER